MRLKSELWVKAYLRGAATAGAPGAVVRHGDDDAGAIFIKINRLDGTAFLFGPAPTGFDSGDDAAYPERQWVPFLKGVAAPEVVVDEAINREIGYDSDVWVIEIESRSGEHFLEGWLLATP